MNTDDAVTILYSDYYSALYSADGVLVHQATPDYLNTETLITLFPNADYYWVSEAAYEQALETSEEGYPHLLADFPLDLCERGGTW